MKTFLLILVTATVTWMASSFYYGLRTGVERVWLISAVKAPGRMALLHVQEDLNKGRYDLAKAKMEILVQAWQKFDHGPQSFNGPGIGDIMIELNKIDFE